MTPTEPDEIDENTDPFVGMEITSDMENNDDNGSHSETVSGDNSGRPDASTFMEYTLTHDILLDSAANSDDEDIDLEDESDDSEAEDMDPDDEGTDAEEGVLGVRLREDGDEGAVGFRYGFDGTELGFVPLPPTRRTGDQQPHRYTAGCVWTKEDWSCSYDAVFMSFWSLYEQSSAGWRDDWVRHAPDWNTPLGNNFDHLIILADTPISAHDHAEWFSRYRDRFRDQLSQANPSSFPRRGPFAAFADRILELMFGRDTGPYLEQHLVCSDCRTLSQTELETWLLGLGVGHDRGTPIPLHTVWTRFIQRSRMDAPRRGSVCSCCKGQNKVRALRMPDVPWIWFERGEHSPVTPSLTLTFDSPPQQLSYSLRAIIYAGGNHFTARFRDQSGSWWRHDGQVSSGVPQADDIQSEVQLLMNDTRFASLLIYRRDDR